MKLISKNFSYILFCSILFSVNCTKFEIVPVDLVLTLSITSNPQGGAELNSVSCSFNGSVSIPDNTVPVTVEWWAENEDHQGSTLKSSEQYVYNSSNKVSNSTVYSISPDYFLLNYYWVKFKWSDFTGDHIIESTKAYFVD